MMSNNLSWKENSNRRANKAMGVFSKSSEVFAEMWYLNEIESMYCLCSTILTFASQEWLQEREREREREREKERERERKREERERERQHYINEKG